MVAVAVSIQASVPSVPRLWPNSTIVCLATGPSLCQEDVDYCRGRAKVIAVKDAVYMAPWADVLYACGWNNGSWWNHHASKIESFAGLRYTLDPEAKRHGTVLKIGAETGLETDPTKLAVGRNSGYQAINLAVHLGAARIVLVGFDMQRVNDRDHFFGNHAWGNRPPFDVFLPRFDTMVEPLKQLGVEVINATRTTALQAFPRTTLAEALA